ncbi:chymotrypsin-2-like, partial [Lasioglossum baleicum]|uniref:chymotrypsin-2-like n=1 Tax=Lasioglossum baleicum TaxID=434251 RepID=UPI003FCDD815
SASADDLERLISGKETQPGQFPYAVFIKVDNKPFCGGAIISKYHVLTAAHCIQNLKNKTEDVVVVTGTIHLNQGGETHRVAALYPHPYYSDYLDKDVGVIKLADPINFNVNQQPIAFPSKRTPANVYATVTGWGSTTSPPTAMSNSQQYLTVKVIDTMSCRATSGFIISEICTLSGPNIGTCTGDSGDPLVYNNEIVGVASRGVPCARGLPDIFTSIYDSLEFIQKTMEY